MPDRKITSLPFESADPAEQRIWHALGDLPQAEPSAQLRRAFYGELERAGSRHWSSRLRAWLGFSNNAGWITAAACLLIGFGAARLAVQQSAIAPGIEPARLAALEESVATLKRQVVLDRLQNDEPGTRLLGVYDASSLVRDDYQIAQALLVRASQDQSPSVRSAAIDALGPQLNSDAVGGELMSLLESAESPIVQLALVDLVLRHGNPQQLAQLLRLANENRLYPDLVRHVRKSLGSETV